jgi:hypothetical protein
MEALEEATSRTIDVIAWTVAKGVAAGMRRGGATLRLSPRVTA